MTARGRHSAERTQRAAHRAPRTTGPVPRIGALTLLFMILGAAGVATAYWTTTGAGTSTASATTLAAPTGVTGVAVGATVTVGFTGVTAPAGPVTGYYVTRYLGATPSNACGTNPATATYLAAAATSCVDTSVLAGTYTYRVTAVFRTWTSQSAASPNVVVSPDVTPPTQVVAAGGATGTLYVTGSTYYFNSTAPGSFTLNAAVTDNGSGPKSATFPATGAVGWTHPAQTVTTGTGSFPTITYTSSLFSWVGGSSSPGTYTVTGSDVQNNTVATNLSFVADSAGPTGGALTVNGLAASSGGNTSYSTTGTFVGTRTNYSADAGSGFVSSVLTREVGTLTAGTCLAYGAPTTLAGNPTETAVAAGCYRYTLTGTDRVGNISTLISVVQVDKTAPTQAFSATGNGSVTGTTLYYRSASAGSFVLSSAVTDGGSGPAQVTFPNVGAGGWTHPTETVTTGTGTAPTVTYASSAYSWTAGPGNPNAPSRTIAAQDLAGNASSQTLTFTADNTAPVTGALTVNGTAASAGGTTSTNATGAYGATRTDYTDAGSGINTSLLTRAFAPLVNGACGTYGAGTPVFGAPTETGLATGCYRYTLTGTDNVGNTASISTVVQVDVGAPTQALAMTGASGAVLSGPTVYYRPTVAGSFTLTAAVTDGASGPKQAVFPAIATANWTHNAQTVTVGTGSAPTITYTSSTFSWTSSPSNPAAYTVTGSDVAGNTVGTALGFVADSTGPTGGVLTVNGVGGTPAGAPAYLGSGNITGTYSAFNADAGAGYQSTTLTRQYGTTLTNGVCSGYGAATTIVTISEVAPAAGCYRYTLVGTDVLGNTSALSVEVRVDTTAPTQVVTAAGPNASVTGTTLYFNGGLAGSTTLTSTVTDTGAGPAQVQFPALAASGWTHAGETVSSGVGAIPTIAYTSGSYSWTVGATQPASAASRTLTASDLSGNTVATALTFVSDTVGPTGGALTVNGTAASAAGTTSGTNATSWTIGTRTDFNADAASGFLSSVLTRQTATWNGTTCGTFGAPVTIVGAAAQTGVGGSCYLYTLTGTDKVGNTTTLSTTVRTGIAITSVTLNNSATGTAGTLNRGDTIVVQYSGPMAVSSMCSTWSGDGTNQSIATDSTVSVTIREGTGAANDNVTVTTDASACGGAFKFGTLTLGSDAYLQVTPFQTFNGTGAANRSTIAYDATTYTLTITLGINQTTPGDNGSNNVPGATTAVLAPDAAITGSTGLMVSGNGTTAAATQF